MWSRRWFRRTTYVLVSGALLLGGAAWLVQRPFVTRWVTAKLDEALREETGLGLQVDGLEWHLLEGRILVNRPRLGEDLLQADRVEAVMDTSALLVGKLRILRLDVDRPRILLDAGRVGRLHLKEHPPRTSKARWEVDRVSVREGMVTVNEPSWGIPVLTSSFSVHGEGRGANRLKLFLDMLSLRVGEGPAALQGQLGCQVDIDDTVLSVSRGDLTLGKSHLGWQGRFETETEKLGSSAEGSLDLASLQRLFAPTSASLSGTATFKVQAWGQARKPLWKISLDGRGLGCESAKLHPGTLGLNASGSTAAATIHQLSWTSPDGTLDAQGTWRKGQGSHLQLHGRGVGLGPLATVSRAEFLEEAAANLEGEAFIPGDPWVRPPMDRVQLDLQVAFTRGGAPAGGATVSLHQGRLTAEDLAIRLPRFTFQGRGTGTLAKGGLRDLAGEGATDTDASVVAEILQAWRIGDKERLPAQGKNGVPKVIVHPFQMAGQTHAQAQVRWTRAGGLSLAGDCEVLQPRWHGAQADRLKTVVSIQDDELTLKGIELFKDEGQAWGELWLAFDPRPAGQDEIDMCFRASRLPVEEGLKAADLDPKVILVGGMGSGWVQIHGPYEDIRLVGGAQAEGASVYGLKIPALSGDFTLDINQEQIQVKDLRVGESLTALGQGEDAPAGLLSLVGGMDMDYGRRTWQAFLKGDLDSEQLGIPGLRFQARVESSLEGPWTQPLGTTQIPLGRVSFRGGRLFLGDQSLEGLEGSLESGQDEVSLRVGMQGKEKPLLTLEGWNTPRGFVGALDLRVGPETADTSHLATRLSRDLLQDLRAEASAEGLWNKQGLNWKGRLNQLVGTFAGFELHQDGPTSLQGDATGATVDLRLQGQSADAPLASFRASGRVPFNRTAPMGLRLEGSAELAKLKPIADHLMELDSYSLLGDLELRGSASFDLALGGPYREPTLDGTLGLVGGSMVVRGYPQGVEDLDLTLRFKGRDILLPKDDPARGLMAQGALAFWGKATWGFGGFTNYDLEARLEEFEFWDIPEGFELQGDLQASLKGSDEAGGLLKGSVQANRMLYRADINLRDLILSNALGGSSATAGLDPEDPLTRIGLDLDLQLPGEPWTFDTNLLKLQGRPAAGSAFRVKGTLARPSLQGKMEFIPGGRVTNLLPAGDIVVERGSIGFSELAQGGPQLDILGRVDVPPYVVSLQIRGNLEALEMNPTSTPALRRDEITAILIDPSLAPTIGSTASASSTLSYGLAKTSSGLLTTLALADFQERLRRTFNLDRVNVAWRPGSSGNSESTVILGKTFTFPGWQLPLVFTRTKVGEVTTLSGQGEWRFGNLVLQLGASQSGSTGLNPAFEVRHTWSPK
jgi:hypothetical protein